MKKTIRIAVAEDNVCDRNALIRQLREYGELKDLNIIIQEFDNGEDIVEDTCTQYDLIFLDIEMPFMDGLTAANHIRERDSGVVLIFLTNMHQYVFQGYKVDALDYLLKPVEAYALSETMNRALRTIKKKEKMFISVRTKDGTIRIDPSEIIYAEVMDHYVIYHTDHDDFTARESISHAESVLLQFGFCRCSQSFLVNLDCVRRVKGSEIYVGNSILRIGRSRKKEFMEALTRYMNEAEL